MWVNRLGARRIVLILSAMALYAGPARAQYTSSIAGVVKDPAGMPVAAVNVEAASSALIEKVRAVATDGQGQYKIVDLPVGTYEVTFKVAGFATIKRDAITLPASFSATVNATLTVGNPEQVITVSGLAAEVDTQGVQSGGELTSDQLAALPTGQTNVTTAANLTPGMNNAATTADVGGSESFMGQTTNSTTYHGKSGVRVLFDGLRTQNFSTGGSPAYMVNMAAVQEMSVQTSGMSAEASSTGAGLNMVPKSGSNTWKLSAATLFTNQHMETDNLSADLVARGLTTTSKPLNKFDEGWTMAGPIKKDKIWLFESTRYWGSKTQFAGIFYNATQGSPTYAYTPDPSRPAYRNEWILSPSATRGTIQLTPRNKLSLYSDMQRACVCFGETQGGTAPESITGWRMWPTGAVVATWSSPVTSKLLLEGGVAAMIFHYPYFLQPGVAIGDIKVTEQSTAISYNGASNSFASELHYDDRYDQRFSVSYITGSHAYKVGFQDEQAVNTSNNIPEGYLTQPNGVVVRGISYTFNKGKPVFITQGDAPFYVQAHQKAEIGIFAQDRWTLKRLTLNYGVRYDNLIGEVPPQSGPATSFLPARSYGQVSNVPNWKDVSPRVGASYDLFGDGKTAVKVSFAKYLPLTGSNIELGNNPESTSVNSVTRVWNDSNGNFIPDCDLTNLAANGECAAISNSQYGLNNPKANTFATNVLNGTRPYFWEWGTELQHQIRRGITVNASYYHNWSTNFLATQNTQQSPSDFSPYCITAPRDPRLPSGGGYSVCGLYDISPAKFNSVTSVVSKASSFVGSASGVNCGTQTPGNTAAAAAYDVCGTNDFINISISTRFAKGIRVNGGVDMGRTVRNTCFVVTSPQQLLDCNQAIPFHAQTQVKGNATYPLPFPGQFTLSATYQYIPGPQDLATYAAPNSVIAPSLGRNLGACGTLTTCTATANVPLITPYTQFEKARQQVDLRLSKTLQVSPKSRLNLGISVFNLTNTSSILTVTTAYGSNWLLPTAILAPRSLQVSGTLSF